MPTYVYVTIREDGSEGEHFEVLQPIEEPPLTSHPESGLPVKRVLTAAFVARPWGQRDKGTQLADRNLEKMGFTKYVKGPRGYEKTMGDGPDLKPRDKK
jgi:hypothetical protein